MSVNIKIDRTADSFTHEGDLVQLVGLSHKSFIITLKQGEVFHTHRGILNHDDLIGLRWGTQVLSHNGSPFFILQPSMTDILRNTKRSTQIMYPKEIGYILLYMGINPGTNIIEAGTGSGSFTTALAFSIGDTGHIYSYELKEANQAIAKQTLEKLGLSSRVDFKIRDIYEGFEEKNVDAVFLDVSNPYDYLKQVRVALKPGGYFGCLVPTTNQVIQVLIALRRSNFAFIEVCDISVRYYKTEPTRFRPTDRMISHTGYLIFARPILLDQDSGDEQLLKEVGLLSKLSEAELEMNEQAGE
jgi:tRNA (adenine57-N1/adenine58-N1)-methyltransferase